MQQSIGMELSVICAVEMDARLLLCSFCVWHINIKVQFHLKLLSHFRRIRHYAIRYNVQQSVNDGFMEKSFILFYYYRSTIFRWLVSQLNYHIESIQLNKEELCGALAGRGWWLDFDLAIRDMQNWKLIDPLRRMAIKIHFLSNCHHEQQLISSTFSWLQMCPLQIPMHPMNLFDAELYAIVWKWNSYLQDDGGGNRNKHFIILF